MIIWPTDLPQSMLVEGFETNQRDGRLRSSTDIGPPKMRPRTSAAIKPVSGVIRCTQDQTARLERFWAEDTRGGILPFMIPAQVFNNAWLLTDDGSPLLTDDGEQILIEDWWLALFAEPPPERPRQRSVVWSCPLSLSVLA